MTDSQIAQCSSNPSFHITALQNHSWFADPPAIPLSWHPYPSPPTASPPGKVPFPLCPFCQPHPPSAINLLCSATVLLGTISPVDIPSCFKVLLIRPSPHPIKRMGMTASHSHLNIIHYFVTLTHPPLMKISLEIQNESN